MSKSEMPHWSSPEGIRAGKEKPTGVFAGYNALLANGTVASVEAHNATGTHGDFCAAVFAYFARKQGIIAPARIADVGCGAGFLSDKLHQHFRSSMIDGFDASDSAIAFAQKTFPHSHFLSHIVDVHSALPGSSKYDMIVCNEFYPFSRVADKEMHCGLIATLLASMAPDGIAFVSQAIACACIDLTLQDVCAALADTADIRVLHFPSQKIVRPFGMNDFSYNLSRLVTPTLKRLRNTPATLCLQIRHKK